MKKIFILLIFSLLFSNKVNAQISEKQKNRIIEAAYISKLCILSLSTALGDYRNMLLNWHAESAKDAVNAINNNDSYNLELTYDAFQDLHDKASNTATSNCQTFPY